MNGITIAYQDPGSGFPLVLINGFASTMDTWNPPVLAALASHFHVIIFDHRGTGYSAASDDPFSIRLFASDTLALMDALGISRAHILGLSMGASVAQELVLAHPERVDRLILVAGTCGGPQGIGMPPGVWDMLSDKGGEPMEIANRMFSVLFPEDWLASHDPWQYCPGAVIPPENARILAGRIPGARLAEIPGAGHGLQYQCPDAFARAVLEFLPSGTP